MGEEKNRPKKVSVLTMNVSMHCKACERTVTKALLKIKGVETVSADMKNHVVVVKGRIEPERVVKKLKKKTGKRVEIMVRKDASDGGDSTLGDVCDQGPNRQHVAYHGFEDCMIFTMFDDENPNACAVM